MSFISKEKSDKQDVVIIGHFGGHENILDGQTIKTKILYQELKNATEWNLIKVDTYYKKHNPIKLVKDTLKYLLTKRTVIVLLSGNGMRFYFPMLYFFSKVFHTRVFHDVIGGNLDMYVKKYPKFRKYLTSFQVNWVEAKSMQTKLEELGIDNCEVIPNFKRLKIVEVPEKEFQEPYRFCMFSRVMKEKGVETAIEAVETINRLAGKNVCELDIYGRIDEGYGEQFERIMCNVTPAIQYKGVVPYDKSVEVIKDYYALLFPTFWRGEGFPGTVIDAFAAGLPVIATDWNCNTEIIENNIEGIIYPCEEVQDLTSAIRKLIHCKNIRIMRENCMKKALCYQPDRYIKNIVSLIENEK